MAGTELKIRINNLTTEGSRLYNELTIESAKDTNILVDNEGKEYTDLRSGLWNVGLGYHNEVTEKFAQQSADLIKKGMFYLDNFSYKTSLFSEVATHLEALVGNYYSDVQFVNSGSEGIELALKIANSFNQKQPFKIAAFEESYHGSFLGGFSISGMDAISSQANNLTYSDTIFVKFPRTSEEAREVLDSVTKEANKLSAFVIEPVLSSSGVVFTDFAFMDELISILHKNDVLVIFDEVATGFYRSGKAFYKDYLTNKPDVLVLSKQINNGLLPFGAVVFTDTVMQRLRKKPIEHYSTQNGNLLGALSAKLTLEYFEMNSGYLESNINETIHAIQDVLHASDIKFRNLGLMFAIPLENWLESIEITNRLRQFGILVYPFENNVDAGITIYPMLTSDVDKTRSDIKRLSKILLRYRGVQ
ncbi:aminotransferase class III-fold pyridoxal phosphate-dependent enzyme (plasmid) [Weissella confusa]|uniref:aminotransferase class III-fold pyridoxal phosphate-dependent enzyme n=1 Tax=Weissella confusa TaxID=1583 RepID=UPI001C6F5EE6|nr:aminotransferase class III-fold pyridoxal phosphate-dependent enzyme [Weissella confusa]QYU58993.1 aminotransferase class III-fold pyridoxal phosphate-dependent enzyme [Weissella confusa]QYU59006.1 aminotransferase class III-fold pyridoxal phosphate-dependent enzyme [Weissella confusa]